MVRWTPPNSTRPLTAIRWRSRAEMLKEHLDSLSPGELRSVRSDYYWLKFGHDAWKREQARKYDPNQPRDDRGRWVDEGGRGNTDFSAARRKRVNEAACDEQYRLDIFKCNLVRTPQCWASANERYAACLGGRIPPKLRF